MTIKNYEREQKNYKNKDINIRHYGISYILNFCNGNQEQFQRFAEEPERIEMIKIQKGWKHKNAKYQKDA